MILRVAYVGTQAHRLLASRDLNAGNIQTCVGLINLAALNANNVLSARTGRYSDELWAVWGGITVFHSAGNRYTGGPSVVGDAAAAI